jgi:hypothetical protein
MIITYLRSSSFNTWDMCQLKYFLNYGLNIKEGVNKAANLGQVVHKVLEVLGLEKLAQQNGETKMYDSELFGELDVGLYSPDDLFNMSYKHYTEQDTSREYKNADKTAYRKQLWVVLNSMYDPRKLNIIAAEPHFDIELPHDWAKYDFTLPNGEVLNGRFSIKGSIDLVTLLKPKPKVVEILDWKTGRRYNWSKDKIKTYEDLCDDPQLRLYHYAACKLYPDVEQFLITIFFSKDEKDVVNGPFTIPFGRDDLFKTELMLEQRFKEIKECKKPKNIWYSNPCNFCDYRKKMYKDTENSLCKHYKNEVSRKGIAKVLYETNTDFKYLTTYGDGGGKTREDT